MCIWMVLLLKRNLGWESWQDRSLFPEHSQEMRIKMLDSHRPQIGRRDFLLRGITCFQVISSATVVSNSLRVRTDAECDKK